MMAYRLVIKKDKDIEKYLYSIGIHFKRYPLWPVFKILYIPSLSPKEKETISRIDGVSLELEEETTHFGQEEPFGDQSEVPIVLAHPLGVEIGLLDAGVAEKYESRAYVRQDKISQNPSHGTFIASQFWTANKLHLAPGAYVRSCVVLEDNSKDAYTLIKNIVASIEENSDVKIWNLSLSVSKNIEKNCFSIFAQVLDYLQQKYAIIIFKTAANDFDFQKVFKPLAQGADTQEGIVVSSINHFDNKRSLFARMGPGPMDTYRPDCVYYGGEAYQIEDKLYMDGVKGWASTGGYRKACGTSFANPVIAKWAAELWSLYPFFSPYHVKAHLLHSCYAERHCMDIGYGVPMPLLQYLQQISYIITDEETLLEGKTKKYALNPEKTYQITYASKQILHFGCKDYIGSYLKMTPIDAAYQAHGSFRYQGSSIEITACRGPVHYVLLIQDVDNMGDH